MTTYRVCARYHRKDGTSAIVDKVRVAPLQQLSVSQDCTIREVHEQVESMLRKEYPDFERLIGLELNLNDL